MRRKSEKAAWMQQTSQGIFQRKGACSSPARSSGKAGKYHGLLTPVALERLSSLNATSSTEKLLVYGNQSRPRYALGSGRLELGRGGLAESRREAAAPCESVLLAKGLDETLAGHTRMFCTRNYA